MKPTTLRAALTLSLLLNLGVVGTVGYRSLQQGDLAAGTPAAAAPADLAQALALDAAQRQHWHELETGFLERLDHAGRDIRAHRDRMIREIFADAPERATIDTELRAIAGLQDAQQRLVIEQLLRERQVLNAAQRQRLAEILLSQPVGPGSIERLHRD